MKTRFILIATMLVTMAGFAQKNEIRNAEKALKSGNTAEAKTEIESVKGMIAGEDEKVQAEYY